MEENIMVTEEKKGMTFKQKLLVTGATVAAGVIGYKFGKAVSCTQLDMGLKKLFEVDPDLECHMWEAIGRTKALMAKDK